MRILFLRTCISKVTVSFLFLLFYVLDCETSTSKARHTPIKKYKDRMLICTCPFFTAVTCPSIETLLSEHVVWRLISGSLNEYGAQVMLSCSPGYYLLGPRLIQCRTNGTWSIGNERPTCKGKEHICLQNILCFLIHIFSFINKGFNKLFHSHIPVSKFEIFINLKLIIPTL